MLQGQIWRESTGIRKLLLLEEGTEHHESSVLKGHRQGELEPTPPVHLLRRGRVRVHLLLLPRPGLKGKGAGEIQIEALWTAATSCEHREEEKEQTQ